MIEFENKQSFTQRMIILLVGLFLMGISIALCSKTGWGADPITVLYDGIAKSLHVTLGIASVIVAIGMVVITFILDRKQLGIGTLVSPFIIQMGIDIAFPLINIPSNQMINFLFFLLGLLGLSLGISMTICADVGKGSYDALLISLSNLFNKEYTIVRWIIDAVLIGLGLCLHGSLTAGTIVAILLLGKCITFFNKQYKKVFNNKI